MVLFAVSSFTCSMPHFIFGDQLIHANDLLFSGVVSTHAVHGASPSQLGNLSEPTPPVPPNICRAPSLGDHLDDDDHPLWGANATGNASIPWTTRQK